MGRLTDSPPFCGFTVGVTADRRGREQSLMLSRLGVEVVRGPAITTLPVSDDGKLREITGSLITDPPDYMVANTGVGIRSWIGMAASWGVAGALTEALAATRIAARGPKAAAAVSVAGLDVWWRASDEQLSSVTARLLEETISGRRVAVQLHGDDRQNMTGQLERAGAEVVEVPVYRWTLPEDPAPALRLVELCCSGLVDVVTFTTGPAARNLVALAETAGRHDDLLDALNREVAVACVGPVCAAAAVEVGIERPQFPDEWRLGSLIRLVSDILSGRRHRFRLGSTNLVLQGSVAIVNGRPVQLTDRERAVLARLAGRPGATFSRQALLRHVWGDPGADPHVVETTVGRLRAKLGPAGSTIETAVRRGYRLSTLAVPVEQG